MVVFGDIAKKRVVELEDVRVVLGDRYVEHLGPETTDNNLKSSWANLQRLFTSNIAVFAVPKDEQNNFTSIVFPIFAALRNRPTLIGEIKRSSGVIRRDFEYALFLKKEDLAKQYLDEWRAGNRLDAENSSYLEIHLNLSLGNSLFILQNDYQKLREIRDLNVPPSIRQQVSEVLHNLVLSNPAELNDWREVQSAYSEERLSYFSNFFDVQTIQSLESLVLATLDEVFKLEPDRKKLKWLTSREVIADLPIIRSISNNFGVRRGAQKFQMNHSNHQVEELIRKNEFASALLEF